MKQRCANCAELLPWFPSGKWVCKKCGTSYIAKRKSKFSVAFGLYGALVMLYLPFLVFAPMPMWVKLYVIPVVYALCGVVLWRNQKIWAKNKNGNGGNGVGGNGVRDTYDKAAQ